MWRALDGPLTLAAFYLAIDAASLSRLHIVPAQAAVIVPLLAAGVLAWSAHACRDRGVGWLAVISGPSAILLVCAVVLVVPFETATDMTRRGWFPPEWHQAPWVWYSLFAAFGGWSIAYFLVWGGLLWLHLQRSRWPMLAVEVLLVLFGLYWTLFAIPEAERFLPLLFPLILAILFGVLRQPILERRSAVVGLVLWLALSNYVGPVPPTPIDPSLPGLTQVYPRPGADALVPTTHMRDALLAGDGRTLFVPWGTTCGLLRIDRETGAVQNQDVDLSRFLAFSEDEDVIYAAGWTNGRYMEYDPATLRLLRSVDLMQHGLGQLFMARQQGDDVYVSSYAPPILARFDRRTMKLLALNDFRDSWSRMSCGAAFYVFSPDGTRIYISIGMTDVPMTFSLMELDSQTLEVLREVTAPEMFLVTNYDAGAGQLLVSSFFSDTLFVVDLASFEVVAEHRGATQARFFVFDEKRQWLIQGSYYTGELVVLDRRNFKELLRRRISRRIQFGHIDVERDMLRFTTTEGAFELELGTLERWIAEAGR
mgnify:CR=1 FL=1